MGLLACPKVASFFARNLRRTYWLVLGLLTACASPLDYKFPDHDEAYKEHLARVKTCSFGGGRSDLYTGYHVRNHILEATEQGGIKYRAKGGAKNDFGLNFARIFNCYQNFRAWAGTNRKEYKQVLIYFNGGLNSARAVRKQAEKQVPIMLKDGYYPVFLIWPTGPLDTYFEQVTFVRNGVRYEMPQLLSAPLSVVGDFGQGLARSPVNYVNQVIRATSSRNPFSDEDRREFFLDRKICRTTDAAVSAEAAGSENSETKVCEATDIEKFAIKNCKVTPDRNLLTGQAPDEPPGPSLRRVPYYGLFATRLISTPLVDAFGKTMWENMVRRTRTTIRQPIEYNIHLADDFKPEDIALIEQDKQKYPNGIGAFARFFTMLEHCIPLREPNSKAASEYSACVPEVMEGARVSWRDIDLTVIGHSMGTIVMNELVPRHRKLPYRNLVFMAAAASVRDTARAMTPVIESPDPKAPAQDSNQRRSLRFYNLMLHPQNDANELVALGAGPSGSLLAWVDEMFEGPKTAIDRTMGKWRNLRAAKHVFPQAAQRNMLFRVYSWDGDWSRNQNGVPRCERNIHDGAADAPPDRFKPPTTHGGFNDAKARFWCPFFWGADKVGWPGNDTSWQAEVCTSGPGTE